MSRRRLVSTHPVSRVFAAHGLALLVLCTAACTSDGGEPSSVVPSSSGGTGSTASPTTALPEPPAPGSVGGAGTGEGPSGDVSLLNPSGGTGNSAAVNDAATPTNPDAGLVTPRWSWAGIIGTGQSLSVGEQARNVTSTTQPFGNLKLALPANVTVPPFDPSLAGLSVVPLVEPIRAFSTTYPSAYPQNIAGETPHSAMANQISALTVAAGQAPYVSVHSVIGENGQPMTQLRKGATEVVNGAMSMGRAYAATLFEVAALTRLARERGLTYGVGAVIITHGEADAGNVSYENDLFQLWSDYDTDLRALTGQSESLVMLVSQQHSVPDGVGARSASTLAEWRAGVDHPGQIVCTGPKYQYDYAADGVHLVTVGYQMLGEKYGQVYHERLVLGRDWQPLQPLAVERSGRVISVRFHVPVAPLAFDATLPAPHQQAGLNQWAQGRGFEVWQGNRRVVIQSLAIAGDSVQITVGEDVGAGFNVGYAATHDGVLRPGGTGRWGQLRDSDPFVGSTTGRAQPNFAVAFELPVP
jgi:hypothetical protein